MWQLIYHYFLAHATQYAIHRTLHSKIPKIIKKPHQHHHQKPHETTILGMAQHSVPNTIDIYTIMFLLYILHIIVFYDDTIHHLLYFFIITASFMIFHGSCHILTIQQQQSIPILRILYHHHYVHHHHNSTKNFGFGDLTYDYLFGTLDLSEPRVFRKYSKHNRYGDPTETQTYNFSNF